MNISGGVIKLITIYNVGEQKSDLCKENKTESFSFSPPALLRMKTILTLIQLEDITMFLKDHCPICSLSDPRGRPQSSSDHYFHTECLSVPKLQNQATITAGRDCGLAEWIIDDSCLYSYLNLCKMLFWTCAFVQMHLVIDVHIGLSLLAHSTDF